MHVCWGRNRHTFRSNALTLFSTHLKLVSTQLFAIAHLPAIESLAALLSTSTHSYASFHLASHVRAEQRSTKTVVWTPRDTEHFRGVYMSASEPCCQMSLTEGLSALHEFSLLRPSIQKSLATRMNPNSTRWSSRAKSNGHIPTNSSTLRYHKKQISMTWYAIDLAEERMRK